MALNGVDIQIDFARELQLASAAIQATPKQLELAGQRAIKKTMRWLQTRISRELAQALGVSQKVLKPRFSLKTVGKGSDAATILWLGVNNLPAEKAGAARQTRRGVTVGKRKYEGSFYRQVCGDEKRVWHRKDDRRFPVVADVIEISDQATDIFSRFEQRIPAQFSKVLEQELNYVVNHERK